MDTALIANHSKGQDEYEKIRNFIYKYNGILYNKQTENTASDYLLLHLADKK